MTVEMVRARVAAIDAAIKEESARKYKGRGIPFVYKVCLIFHT
jgi:hypothetical protein